MHMFIANGTQQNIDFQYRLPNVKNYRAQLIPIGQQIKISGELSQEDINAIITGHSIYGMVASKEIANFRGFFIPYVYSINSPISSETMSELIVQNRIYHETLGKKLREEAAVAVSSTIENNTTDNLKSLEMSIEELPSKDRDATFSEGIRVTREKEKGAPQGPDKGQFDYSRKVIRPSF
jgi:hypothetical protein